MKRLIVLVLTIVLVLIATTIFLFMHHEGGLSEKINFSLIDHNNIERTEKYFHGKWLFVYLGFTSCPKICPLQMSVMGQVMQELDISGHSSLVIPMLISVDPDRDTPEKMKNYIAHFDARILGLTGAEKEIIKVKKLFRAFSRVERTSGVSEYDVIHSDYFYLVDPNGEIVRSYANDQDYLQLTRKIRNVLDNNIES